MSENRSSRGPVAVGALSGLVAALLMTLVQALLRLGLGVPSPAELIGDRLGERVPVKPFLDLIGLIGSYGRLKALACSACWRPRSSWVRPSVLCMPG